MSILRSVRLYARARLLTKHGNKDYYKGNGGGKLGRHTKHGGYEFVAERLREFVVPDLTDCKLKPYVSHETKPLAEKALTVARYIEESQTLKE